MTTQAESGDRQIRAFRGALTEILGSEDLPDGVVGDLSDLFDTLRRGEGLLMGLMELRSDFKRDAAAKLLELELFVGDDLRMIARDLLPALKKVRKAAYSIEKRKLGKA
jgi:hypothetical protein